MLSADKRSAEIDRLRSEQRRAARDALAAQTEREREYCMLGVNDYLIEELILLYWMDVIGSKLKQMTPAEISRYTELVIDSSRGAGRIACWLCGQVFAAGERALLIPTDCAQTARMDAKQDYDGLFAHRACLVKIP